MTARLQKNIFWAVVIVLAIVFFIAGWVIRDIGIGWLGFIIRWVLPVGVIAGAVAYRSRSAH
jgi:hypothetical protein